MHKKKLYLLFLLLLTFSVSAQINRTAKWYFGNNAALDFMSNPPVSLSNNTLIPNLRTSASISDPAGNLLFYSNTSEIRNQLHQLMPNSTGLLGQVNWSNIIAKQPGSNNMYYFFHINQTSVTSKTLYYSIVDMNLAAGLGSVTVINSYVYGTDLSRNMAATKHCNGRDIWLAVTEPGTGNFRSYLLTSTGLNTVAVVSSVGTANDGYGQMQFSPNGTKLGMADRNIGLLSIFDFDNSTGVVSNEFTLPGAFPYTAMTSCEFSPDGTKFYAATFTNTSNSLDCFLHQWDLCAGSPTAIAASVFTVSSPQVFFDLQLAKDGKIYGATRTATLLEISNPNIAGAGCNFTAGPVLSTGTSWDLLPNFLSSDFLYHPLPAPFTYTVNPLVSCQTASYTAPPAPITATGCSVSYSLLSMAWNFGDPASGAANTSTLTNPVHVFSGPGTYSTQLIFYYSCGGGSDTLWQNVSVQGPSLSINSSSITCASLGSATITAIGGSAPITYTWLPGGQTGAIATGLIPGTYSVNVVTGGGSCVLTTTANFAPLIPLTGSLQATGNLTCNAASNGSATVNNLSGGSGTQSYLWSNGSLSYTPVSVSNLTAGLWSVTVTDALTACQINSVFTITQPPAFNLSITASSASACVGSSIVLTGTNSGGTPGYTYSWCAGPAGNTRTVSPLMGGNYTYTLSSSDASACVTSSVISVSFINNPVLSLSSVSICPLQSGNLVVSGASSYTWGGGLNSNTFTDNPLVSTNYSVVGSALGCTSIATASIVLKSSPIPTLSSNAPLCEASSLSLSALGGTAYTWVGPFGSGFSSGLQNPVINPVGLLNAGVYTATVTAANSCTAVASSSVLVYNLPSLAVTGSTLCSGSTLSLSSISSATNLLWTGPLGFNSVVQNPLLVNATPGMSGNYTLTVTSADGCTLAASAFASVVPPPNLGISLSSNSLCAQALSGSPNTITLTANGASTYTISTPNHIYNPNPAGPSSPLNMVPPYQPTGPATATVSGSNGVCTVSASVVFTIIPNPTVSVANPTPVICTGESYTYTSSGATSYTWSAANPGNTLYTTGNVAVANPSINSVFSVVGGSLGCNSAIQSSTLTVNPLPLVMVNSAVICPNTSAVLTASGTGTSYSWSPSIGLTNTVGSSVSTSPITTQNYIVTALLNNCTANTLLTVSVMPLPTVSISQSKQEVCLYDQITLTGSGGQTYLWSGPGNVILAGQQVIYTASNLNQAGMFTLTITDGLGCKNSSTTPIGIKQLPNGSMDGTKNGCVPLCTDLSFKGNASTSSVWNIANQTFSNTVSYCFKTPGTFTVGGSLYDAVSTCSNNIGFVVNVYPNPKAGFEFSPTQPLEGLEEVLFTNTSSGQNLNSYSWHFNNNSGFTSSSEHTSYTFQNEGVYPIAMVVSNANGCSDTIIKTITVEPNFNIYVPNAFTPNGDNLNDVFKPVGSGIKTYSLLIFDRWGGKLFESATILVGWDGTYKGEPAKMDIYNWKISATNAKGEKKEMAGHVNLLR